MTEGNPADSELCKADGMTQTLEHIVEECSAAHYFPVGMKSLHIDWGRYSMAD